MRVAFVYDARAEYLAEGSGPEEVAEFDEAATIEAIAAALERQGCEVTRIRRGRNLAARLAAGERWDLVFSIAEGLAGRAREAQVPALCEMFDQPYAFSDPLTMAVPLDKAAAKRIVRDHGIPTADFALLHSAADAAGVDLAFPLFVKPVAEGTGKGCGEASLVRNPRALGRVVAAIVARYRQAAPAETFLPGREFTVGILGTGSGARVLGVMEVTVRAGGVGRIYSFEMKERSEEMVALEARRAELEAEMREKPEPLPRLHPGLAEVYRQKVADLTAALNHDDLRTEAAEAIRALIEKIRLIPRGGGALVIELIGALAGILALGKKERPRSFGRGRQLTLVAGAGFEPATFRL